MVADKILIVDDEETLCEVLKLNLENEGYDVDVAYSAEEALAMDLKVYSLILLDIMMPLMDGITATAKIRTYSDVPIILLTAKSETQDMVLGLNVGASAGCFKIRAVAQILMHHSLKQLHHFSHRQVFFHIS